MRWVRARLQPFETAFAAIIVVQGVITLTGSAVLNPANALLPSWLAWAFQIAYIASGAAILAGLLWPRGDVEGAGLVLLGVILLARGILFGQLLGWGLESITSLTFSAFLAGACLSRFLLLSSTTWGQPKLTVIVAENGEDQ